MKASGAVLARKGKHLTAQDEAEIIAEHQSGSRSKWIAKRYSVHPTTISKVIKKFEGCHFFDRRRGSGRPSKTTNTTDEQIIEIINSDRSITLDTYS